MYLSIESADPALRVEAMLTDSAGNPLGGKPVYFYVSGDGSTWTLIAVADTGSDGRASVTYTADRKTWFRAEFKGDNYYEPSSATAVWEPAGAPAPACEPVFRTGIEFLDRVVFCIRNYGITVFVLVLALIVLLVLLRRSR
jgi:hypothetical protein